MKRWPKTHQEKQMEFFFFKKSRTSCINETQKPIDRVRDIFLLSKKLHVHWKGRGRKKIIVCGKCQLLISWISPGLGKPTLDGLKNHINGDGFSRCDAVTGMPSTLLHCTLSTWMQRCTWNWGGNRALRLESKVSMKTWHWLILGQAVGPCRSASIVCADRQWLSRLKSFTSCATWGHLLEMLGIKPGACGTQSMWFNTEIQPFIITA